MLAHRLASALARPWPLFFLVLGVSVYRFFSWTRSSGLSLFADEAQYWTWAQALDWGYYSKPPAIAALIRLTTALTDSDETWALKLVPVLVYPLTAMLVYALGRSLFRPQVGRDAALLFLLMPGVWLSAVVVSTDVPLLLFWSAALLALWRALHTNAWNDWVCLGIAGGLGLLSKYNMGFFALAVLAFALFSPGERRLLLNPRLYVAAIVAALVFLPNVLWNVRHDFITFEHHIEISRVREQLFNPLAFLEFLAGQFAVFGPISFAAFLALAARKTEWRGSSRPLRFALAFALTPLLLTLILSWVSRAYANWAAMAYVGAAVLLALWLQERRRLLVATLAVNVALGLTFYHGPPVLAAAGVTLPPRLDPYQRVRGWEALGYEVQRLLQEYPDAQLLGSERKLMALLLYYARPLSEPRIWAPPGPPKSHYHLSIPLTEQDEGPHLWISQAPPRPEQLARFERSEYLREIVVRPYPGLERRCQVWRVDGFRGYAEPFPPRRL